tara:strand:- start:2545 stop:2988 length:444 start_codon:yes stop_codon:yes gene_type:complete
MAYLGNAPKNNLLTMNSSQYSGDNSNTTFTLSQSVGNVNEIEVYVGNVRQDPFSAYSVTGGTSLVFTAAPPLGTNNVYVVYQGKAVGTTTPGENSIEFGMIKSINGGYENLATISTALTIDATDNMMLCGPVSFTGTVTVNGTLTVV